MIEDCKWNQALGIWMPQKVVKVLHEGRIVYVPLFRYGKPVYALPGGKEYV